jgi:hypothetical protein
MRLELNQSRGEANPCSSTKPSTAMRILTTCVTFENVNQSQRVKALHGLAKCRLLWPQTVEKWLQNVEKSAKTPSLFDPIATWVAVDDQHVGINHAAPPKLALRLSPWLRASTLAPPFPWLRASRAGSAFSWLRASRAGSAFSLAPRLAPWLRTLSPGSAPLSPPPHPHCACIPSHHTLTLRPFPLTSRAHTSFRHKGWHLEGFSLPSQPTLF